jgi:hypothetical protein
MTDLIKITRVEPRHERWVRLWFSDGAVKDVNLAGLLARGGVFTTIRDDRAVFEAVRVNPESQTIEWPGEIDLDPGVLYGRADPASGITLARQNIREPAAA